MTIALDVLTLGVAGTMVGNEFAVSAFVSPVLWRMEERSHAHTASALATAMGLTMPTWYALTLFLTVVALWEHRTLPFTSGPGTFLLAAAIGWCCTICFAVLRLFPLTRRLASMSPDSPPRGWLADRSRWDGRQHWLVALLLVSFSLLSLGILGVWRDYAPASRTVGSVTHVTASL